MGFYENYVQLCSRMGKTPSGAAREMGISKASVSCWKSRKTEPTDANKQRIADYFGISVDELMGTKKEPPETGEPVDPVMKEIMEKLSALDRAGQLEALAKINSIFYNRE